MSDNPYNKAKGGQITQNPENYTEMIEERFDRKDQSNQYSVIIFVVLSFLVATFFYYLIICLIHKPSPSQQNNLRIPVNH